MNRKGPWEGYRRQTKPSRPLSPFRLPLRAFLKRDVWVRGRSQLVGGEPVGYLTIVVEDLNLRLP